MQILSDKHLIPISQAAAERDVHVATLWRWRRKGVHGVRLEVLHRGGGVFTSVEALERFDEAVTAAANSPAATSLRANTKSAKHREIVRAKLAAAGL